jgi:hypothetical protein
MARAAFPAEHQLGRLLFERRPSRASARVWGVAAAVLLWFTLLFAYAVARAERRAPSLWLSLVGAPAALTLVFALRSLRLGRHALRVGGDSTWLPAGVSARCSA